MPQSGIYQIVNAITQDYYVGSSVNIANRWTRHVTDLRGGKHINQRLQRAWDKYGEKSFVFSVLEEEVDAKNLIPREQWWIDTLTPEYNIRKIVDLKAPPDDETREKIRQSKLGKKRSPEFCETMRRASSGKKQSPEHIQKRVAHGVSEETKQKLRDARKASAEAGKPHGGPKPGTIYKKKFKSAQAETIQQQSLFD